MFWIALKKSENDIGSLQISIQYLKTGYYESEIVKKTKVVEKELTEFNTEFDSKT